MTTIIIPARMASERMPGKPLRDIGGKPLIVWTVEAALRTGCTVVVATPDAEIATVVGATDALAFITHGNQRNGSERVAFAASMLRLEPDETVINWQCDAPAVGRDEMRDFIRDAEKHGGVRTLVAPSPPDDGTDKASVGVVYEHTPYGTVLWFERQIGAVRRWCHIGVYSAPVWAWQNYMRSGRTRAEVDADLEQLRWLAMGVRIHARLVPWVPELNTEDDMPAVVTALSA